MAQVTETVARGILAGHGYTDNEVRQLAHHWLASHGQAPAGATLPDGWVPLTITHEGQYPEEVAYGPQIMMDRLGKWLGKYFAQAAQAADNVPAVSDLPPLPAPDLRDVGTKPQEIKEFLKGYATEYARTAIAARAPADSVQEDAALWHWLAEYLVGTRTDLDDEIVACETVNDLRNLVESAIKQGEKQ